MNKQFILIGAFIGAITVGLGAFGAHALKAILSATALTTYETGVRYQFYHCIALILVGIIYQAFPSKWLRWSGNLFIAGIVLFSGSLYLLSLLEPGYRWMGAITPFGGLSFILGWLFLAVGVASKK